MKRDIVLKKSACFFAVLVLFQACTVYKTANMSLAEASAFNTKVEVKYIDKSKVKYSNVVSYNNKFYGITRVNVNGKWTEEKILLEEDKIETIRVKDDTNSTILSIAIPALVVAAILTVLLINYDPVMDSIR